VVNFGSAVNLTISRGPEHPQTVAVPDVVGMSQSQAESAITSAGLTVGAITQSPSETVPQGQVISQNPAEGTSVEKGTAVSLVVSSGPPVSQHIIWVSDSHRTLAGSRPDDQGWVDLLRSVGYEVDYQPRVSAGVGYWQTLDPTRLAALEAADLIIISRDTYSPAYSSDAAEITRWNSLQRPLILLNAYLVASNRWLWINSTNMGVHQSYYVARAVAPQHPVFNGVTLDASGQVVWLDRAVAPGFSSYINTTAAGSGHVIAARPDNNYVVIAEWAAGRAFYSGSTQTQGGQRLFFSAGTQETADTLMGYGVYDLTTEGGIMFLNAVACMIAEPNQPGGVDSSLVGWWKLDESSADIVHDSIGLNDGVTRNGPTWQPTGGKVGGALEFDGLDDCVVTSFVLDPAAGPFSVFAWIKGGGAGQVIISQDGDAGGVDWLAASSTGQLITALVGKGRFAKSLTSDRLITDGQWHETGLVWDGTSRTLYVDGAAVATDTPAAPASSTGGLNIGTGKNLDTGTFWLGLIDDIRIYNQAVKP
jgi:hypothetical protein